MESADTLIDLLRRHNIQPTPQRLAVAACVLNTTTHPTAEEVWREASAACPTLSRATTYNTLSLLVQRGLLAAHRFFEGVTVYDPAPQPHHHLVDEDTGAVFDIPWGDIQVGDPPEIPGFEITDFHVVVRGRRSEPQGSSPSPGPGRSLNSRAGGKPNGPPTPDSARGPRRPDHNDTVD